MIDINEPENEAPTKKFLIVLFDLGSSSIRPEV